MSADAAGRGPARVVFATSTSTSTSTTPPAHEELAVCVVCLHLLANGEYEDGTDAAASAAAGMQRRWGDLAARIVADGTDLGFRATACEGCGNTDHGDRYRAVLLPEQGRTDEAATSSHRVPSRSRQHRGRRR